MRLIHAAKKHFFTADKVQRSRWKTGSYILWHLHTKVPPFPPINKCPPELIIVLIYQRQGLTHPSPFRSAATSTFPKDSPNYMMSKTTIFMCDIQHPLTHTCTKSRQNLVACHHDKSINNLNTVTSTCNKVTCTCTVAVRDITDKKTAPLRFSNALCLVTSKVWFCCSHDKRCGQVSVYGIAPPEGYG